VGWICSEAGARAGFLVAGGTALGAALLLMPALHRLRRTAESASAPTSAATATSPEPVTAPIEPP
jgi:hypothetical protein